MDKLTDNKFLFSFEGRINRFKYWYALFASGIFCLVLLLLLAFVIGGILGADVKSIHIRSHVLDVFLNPPSFPFSASFGDAGATPHAALIALPRGRNTDRHFRHLVPGGHHDQAAP